MLVMEALIDECRPVPYLASKDSQLGVARDRTVLLARTQMTITAKSLLANVSSTEITLQVHSDLARITLTLCLWGIMKIISLHDCFGDL